MTRLMLLFAATIATSGCVTTSEPSVATRIPDVSCTSFQIIRPSRDDTLDTKRQVLAHNNTWRALCERN